MCETYTAGLEVLHERLQTGNGGRDESVADEGLLPGRRDGEGERRVGVVEMGYVSFDKQDGEDNVTVDYRY